MPLASYHLAGVCVTPYEILSIYYMSIIWRNKPGWTWKTSSEVICEKSGWTSLVEWEWITGNIKFLYCEWLSGAIIEQYRYTFLDPSELFCGLFEFAHLWSLTSSFRYFITITSSFIYNSVNLNCQTYIFEFFRASTFDLLILYNESSEMFFNYQY